MTRASDQANLKLDHAGVAIDDIERIAPSIEDLFVSLLTTESEA